MRVESCPWQYDNKRKTEKFILKYMDFNYKQTLYNQRHGFIPDDPIVTDNFVYFQNHILKL